MNFRTERTLYFSDMEIVIKKKIVLSVPMETRAGFSQLYYCPSFVYLLKFASGKGSL